MGEEDLDNLFNSLKEATPPKKEEPKQVVEEEKPQEKKSEEVKIEEEKPQETTEEEDMFKVKTTKKVRTEPTQAAEVVSTTEVPKPPEIFSVVEEQKPKGTEKHEFGEIKEDLPGAKSIYTIHSDKGEGKTTIALSFPGEKVAISMDNKTAIIKETRYDNANEIHVFNGMKYMDYHNQSATVKSASITYDYVLAILDYSRAINPDWIIFDAVEYLHQVCEWKMRYNNGLEAYAGIANFNLWKERKTLLRQIHNKAMEIAKKGVIYTLFSEKDELVIQGEIITTKKVPKWIDVIMTETDYVIKAEHDLESKKHYAVIVTSKDPRVLKTGVRFDITGKKFWDVKEEVAKNAN